MKNNYPAIIGVAIAATMLSSCAIVRPGQMGFKQSLGVIKSAPYLQGVVLYNPFVTKIVRISVRTVESYNVLPLPTKEGLSVKAEISLLYHVNPCPRNKCTLFR